MSGGSSVSFLGHLLFLEALFHPVDTLRTRYVADGNSQYRTFVDAMRATKPSQLFNGFAYKMIWTSAVGFSLVNSASGNDNTVGYLAMVAAYPFLTLKVLSQVGGDAGSLAGNFGQNMSLLGRYLKFDGLRSLYKGATPYAAMIAFAHYHFPHIWSAQRKESEFKRLEDKWMATMTGMGNKGSRNYGF